MKKGRMAGVIKMNFSPFPELETERLRLRQLDTSDANNILILRSDPEISKYIERPLYKTISDANKFIERINAGIAKNDWLYWVITFKSDDNMVGTACLWNADKKESKAEIGYELLKEHQGKGIMREAIKPIIDYAFKIMEVEALEAYTNILNEKSVNLLKKSKFRLSEEIDEDIAIYTISI